MFASIRSQQVFLNRKILGQLIVWLRIRQLLVARKMDRRREENEDREAGRKMLQKSLAIAEWGPWSQNAWVWDLLQHIWVWARYLTSLFHSVLICKMGSNYIYIYIYKIYVILYITYICYMTCNIYYICSWTRTYIYMLLAQCLAHNKQFSIRWKQGTGGGGGWGWRWRWRRDHSSVSG